MGSTHTLLNIKGFTPNRSRVEGDTAYIELTDRQDKKIAEAIISASDLDRVLAAGRWHESRRSHTSYVARSYRENGKPSMEWLHRFIMQPASGMVIDHINHNGLDNRSENLRIITLGENTKAVYQKRTIAKSGVRNVRWDKRKGKWFVHFRRDGKQTFHGYFSTIEEAKIVADSVRKEKRPIQERPTE